MCSGKGSGKYSANEGWSTGHWAVSREVGNFQWGMEKQPLSCVKGGGKLSMRDGEAATELCQGRWEHFNEGWRSSHWAVSREVGNFQWGMEKQPLSFVKGCGKLSMRDGGEASELCQGRWEYFNGGWWSSHWAVSREVGNFQPVREETHWPLRCVINSLLISL